ncbi:MAG: hypothetical protein ACKPGK_04525, partial [Verrucomicrobiota bacterium]
MSESVQTTPDPLNPQPVPFVDPEPTAKTSSVKTKDDKADSFRLPGSDDDFSQAFLSARGNRLRFCPDLETWLHFSPEEGWRRDETGRAYATLLEFARQLVKDGLE